MHYGKLKRKAVKPLGVWTTEPDEDNDGKFWTDSAREEYLIYEWPIHGIYGTCNSTAELPKTYSHSKASIFFDVSTPQIIVIQRKPPATPSSTVFSTPPGRGLSTPAEFLISVSSQDRPREESGRKRRGHTVGATCHSFFFWIIFGLVHLTHFRPLCKLRCLCFIQYVRAAAGS